ncbi:MAG: hypothetical protein ACU0DI_09460 [Paracoccaceae bacterium]
MAGDRLAVIHDIWWTPPSNYFDPMKGAKTEGKRYTDFIAALNAHDRAIMQRTAEDGSFARLGYVGVFRFNNLAVGDDGSVSLTIFERLPLRPSP